MDLPKVFRAKTAVLNSAIDAGLFSRQLNEESATEQEIAMDATFEASLIPVIYELIITVFRQGTLPPEGLTQSQMREWVVDQYQDADTDDLVDLLYLFGVPNWELGMQLALDAMGYPASSATLTNDDVTATIKQRAEENGEDKAGAIFGTTIDQVTGFLIRLGVGLAFSEALDRLSQWAEKVATSRSASIAATEDTLWVNQGVTGTYRRNGVIYVEWLTRPYLSATGTCPICEPLHGLQFKIAPPGGFSFLFTDNLEGLIGTDPPPLHPECKCILEPVLDGITIEEIWAGQ